MIVQTSVLLLPNIARFIKTYPTGPWKANSGSTSSYLQDPQLK